MLVDQGPQATFGMPAPLGQVQIDPATGQVIGLDNQQQLGGMAMPSPLALGSLFNPGTLGPSL
jgi:hypothetical protein